jgi:hypothetical protein
VTEVITGTKPENCLRPSGQPFVGISFEASHLFTKFFKPTTAVINMEESAETTTSIGKPVSKCCQNQFVQCFCNSTATAQPHAELGNVKDAVKKMEKRQTSNRLSAQRLRMRKKAQLADLRNQILALKNEHDDLQHENTMLQDDLRMQLVLYQLEARMNATARVGGTQRAALRLGLGFPAELLFVVPTAIFDPRHSLNSLLTLEDPCLKASRSRIGSLPANSPGFFSRPMVNMNYLPNSPAVASCANGHAERFCSAFVNGDKWNV